MALSPRVSWTDHAGNPSNWSTTDKWVNMLIACIVTFMTGVNATAITTGADDISSEFGLENGRFEDSFLAVTAWNAAAALVPLATLPLMDTYGIRVGYSIAYVIFTIFIIPQALAKSFATLVVSRVIAGAAGGTLQNAADGVAANLFLTHSERVLPLTVYIFVLLFGVTMGPVLGAVVQPLGWRWILWIQLIVCGSLAPVVLFFMKESRASIIHARLFPDEDEVSATHSTDRRSVALKLATDTVKRSVILLTTEPIISSFTLWSAFSFGLVFISTQSVPLVFGEAFGWETYQAGLVQTAMGIGQIVGFMACLVQNRIYLQSIPRNIEDRGVPIPESILHLAIPSTAVGLAGGLFMYGWSTDQSHWVVPAIALGLMGYAIMVIVNAGGIYITDSYSGYAASAIAAIAFGENTFAAFLPLAAKPMYLTLGRQWASSLLGFAALLLTLAPVVLWQKGPYIRSLSPAIKHMKYSIP